MNLAPNFTFEELTNSTSFPELVEENRQEALNFMENLIGIAHVLQVIRDGLNKPITVTSGFRGSKLNPKVSKNRTSSHTVGRAADIVVKDMRPSEVFEWMQKNQPKFNGTLHKVILEQIKGKEWLHVEYNRQEVAKGEFYTSVNGKDFTLIA